MSGTIANGRSADPDATAESQPTLWPVATGMAAGIFATAFVQLQGLGYLPFNHAKSTAAVVLSGETN